jgi:hypothetical protein
MSFQIVQWVVGVLLIVSSAFVGLIVLAFPVLAVVSVRQLSRRRRRNWRDRWARQRALLRVQQAFTGFAASNHATRMPAIEDYPEPEEAG